MRDVKLDKEELIKKIEANMETHQATYETAVDEFNRQQLELLKDMVDKASKGKKFDRLALSRMPVPENHMNDYRRALEMLEMELRKTVTLDEHEFNQFVLDEWEWRRNFHANTEAYSIAAANR